MRSELRWLSTRLAGLLAGPLAPRGARVVLSEDLQGALSRIGGGGRMGRLWQDWILRPIESIDQEVLRDLRRARRGSRELVATWGPPARWVRLAEEQIIGHQGMQFRAQLKKRVRTDQGMALVPDLERNRRIERAWYRWTRADQCDVAGRLTFQTQERLFVKTWARDGEALARMVPGFPNAFGFALQQLDPDQLDDRYSLPAGPGQNAIRAGVEIDGWGRPVAYHVFTAHPNDLTRERVRERVPADQILHHFEHQRAGQSRGVPRLLSSFIAAKMTAGYEEAEVTAARSNAIRMGFYKRDPAAVPAPGSAADKAEDRIFWEGEPGQFGLLPAGWSVDNWAPTHPTANAPAFLKMMMRSIALGVATAYNTFANDLEGVNFSSLRSGTLAERDRWQVDQQDMIPAYHLRIFPLWVAWAVLKGQLRPEDMEVVDPEFHSFQPRGWPWVDPLKDVQSDILAIRAGLWSRTRATAARGVDLEEVLQELAAEQALADELGLDLETDLGGRPIDTSTDEGGSDGGDRAVPGPWGDGGRSWRRAGARVQGPARGGDALADPGAPANGRGAAPPV